MKPPTLFLRSHQISRSSYGCLTESQIPRPPFHDLPPLSTCRPPTALDMSRARTGPYATPDYFQTTKIPLCGAFQCSRHARMQIHDDDDVGGKIPNKTMSLVLLFRMRRISTDLAGPAYLVQPPSYPVKSLCVAHPWSRSLGAGVKSSCSLCGEWLHERAIRSAFSRHTGRSVSKGCAVETIRRSSLSLFLSRCPPCQRISGKGT